MSTLPADPGADPADVRRLAAVLVEVTERVRFCRVCGNVAVDEECRICQDPRRDLSVICVVEEARESVGRTAPKGAA